jgi:D-glycero-D-manno-heptose 1,7-bisphosphate phosphatase
MHRAVFLDRDNTIIHNDADLGDPDQVRLIQGAASAIASLRGLGFRIVVVSNQGGVARGKYGEADVDATNQRIAELLKQQANGAVIDAFYYCPYHPEGSEPKYRREHPWRKPQPGMLLAAAEDLQLDLKLCWMVGDQPRDVEAGRRAQARTILLGEQAKLEPSLTDESRPDFFAHNLIEAARIVAQHLRPEPSAEVHLGGEKSDPPRTQHRPGATYPAVQDLGTARSTAAQPRQAARPFKPWEIQPTDQTGQTGDTGKGAASDAPPSQPPQTAPQTPTATTPSPEPMVSQISEPQDETTSAALHQIARHLRRRESARGEWSLYKTLAIGAVQPLAGAAVVIGLINSPAIVAWLLGAIGLQLLVITLLILHGQE